LQVYKTIKMETNQGGLDSVMLPFVMRELVELVMKKKVLSLEDALYYIYSKTQNIYWIL